MHQHATMMQPRCMVCVMIVRRIRLVTSVLIANYITTSIQTGKSTTSPTLHPLTAQVSLMLVILAAACITLVAALAVAITIIIVFAVAVALTIDIAR